MATKKERYVLVTTEHRGVFAGYATETDGEVIHLRAGRNCVYWAAELKVCTANALHATLLPPKHSGERWWIVALIGEVQGDDYKMGALEREILGECL